MRLRLVVTVDFRKSELTHLRDLQRLRPHLFDVKHGLRREDVILLVSTTGNQLVFVHNFDHETKPPVVRSVRLRLTTQTPWNPLMLAEYARRVGLRLEGVKAFEEHLRAQGVRA